MLLRGYRHHHDPRALIFLVPGLVLLWVGGFLVDGHDTVGPHALLVVLGGSCLALAHLTNLRLQHANCDCVTAA
jgi:hypothetical protein